MSALFSQFIFLNPWVLSALIVLPLLWLFLRITPPKPKRIMFPALRLLKDLVPEDLTPSKTPWWLLLLRLLVLAFVILALAEPISNPSDSLKQDDQVLIVVDNGWSGAQNWDKKIREGIDILGLAGRANLNTTLVTTAAEGETQKPQIFGPFSANNAESQLKGLAPHPWFHDYPAVIQNLETLGDDVTYQTFFLSDGLDKPGIGDLISALNTISSRITLIKPEETQLPPVLKRSIEASIKPQIAVMTHDEIAAGTDITVQAVTRDARVLDFQSFTTKNGEALYNVEFEVPELLQNDISQFVVRGGKSAAAKYLLDDEFQRRNVGIVASEDDSENAPLIEASFYIRRALSPYANLRFGSLSDLTEAGVSVIIMPDIASIPTETLNTLGTWVDNGGLLLRFAGPNMTQSLNEAALLPIAIRVGGRSLGGSLTWENPLKLGPFPENSPFFGLEVPEDVTVRQQILAEPGADLSDKTWAVLEDGTPLVTAAQKGKGFLVFMHTTATADWSDMALSGLYVQLLRRIVNISGKPNTVSFSQKGFLEPISVLNGFGLIEQPGPDVKPIDVQSLNEVRPSIQHPPGLYGSQGLQQRLNLGDSIESLQPYDAPLGVVEKIYDNVFEIDYKPYLLAIAFGLLLLDWLIMILFISGLQVFRKRAASILVITTLVCATLGLSSPVSAQDQISEFDMKYANDLYLAYVKTGQNSVDSTSQAGLEVLAQVLKRRTSVEPLGAVGLNLETDTLSFFPLIYWPISGQEKKLSLNVLRKVQHYLEHGGTILFDTRDQNMTATQLGGSRNAESLRLMIGDLNIPPLLPIPENHVLGKSFYLLDSYPGQFVGGTLWVEAQSESGRDGVSSVLIGSHDWARAWSQADSRRRALRGTSRQQEMSLRFGVNLMMYALTGNYKADQVHVPYILERLGQ